MIHVILLTEFDDFFCRSRTRSRTGKRTKFIPSFHQRVETAAIVVAFALLLLLLLLFSLNLQPLFLNQL